MPLSEFVGLFLMLFDPQFVSGFVHLQVGHFVVGVVAAHSRHLAGQLLCVLIKKVLFPFVPLLGLQVLKLLFDLLFGFVQIIVARSRGTSVLLFHGDAVQIGEFAETEIQLVVSAFLFIFRLVPWISKLMVAWRGESLDHLYVIVHVEPSASDVVSIFASLRCALVDSFRDDLARVEIFAHWQVFGIIPGNVSVRIVAVDDFGRKLRRVTHQQFYYKKVRRREIAESRIRMCNFAQLFLQKIFLNMPQMQRLRLNKFHKDRLSCQIIMMRLSLALMIKFVCYVAASKSGFWFVITGIMQYLKSIKPFELIAALADKHLPKSQPAQSNRPSEPPPDADPTSAQAENFIVGLKTISEIRNQADRRVRHRSDIFSQLEIDPHYLNDQKPEKMLEFEFQMGSDLFLSRIADLYDQTQQVDRATSSLLATATPVLEQHFAFLEDYREDIQKLLDKIADMRDKMRAIKDRKQYVVLTKANEKKLIKKKIGWLVQIRHKNEAAFLEVRTLDEAFASQHNRSKLYRQLQGLTTSRPLFLKAVIARLISTARITKKIVQSHLPEWIECKLSPKQIQKLALLIFSFQKEALYRDNGFQIDFMVVDKEGMKARVSELFGWKQYRYLREGDRGRVQQFLRGLIQRLQ